VNIEINHDVQVKKKGFRGTREPLRDKYAGFKIGDRVRLKIVAVPPDHEGTIIGLNRKLEFTVRLKSRETPDASGKWGPIWADEMELLIAKDL
jgi:hypothetical protein